MSKKDLVIHLASGEETLSETLFVSKERKDFIRRLIQDLLHPLKHSGYISQDLKTISESAENVQELIFFVYMYASMKKDVEKFMKDLLGTLTGDKGGLGGLKDLLGD